jgi:hypothetical protein
MIIKCNCNHCSAHLEFDAENAGQVIACPTCGIETTLCVPPPTDPLAAPSSPAEALKKIRQQSCYRTLRSLIGLVQALCFIVAGLIALGSFVAIPFRFNEGIVGVASGAVVAIVGLLWAFLIIVLAIAGKQAALLLVDIADCQIRLAGKGGN